MNPSAVTLSATASGPELNDLLQSVAFYANGSLVGTATAAPYSVSWSGPALGTYTLTAVATDSQGAQTTSAARTVIVSDQNQPPTVSIVTPLDNSRWHSPASFMFQANASSGEANDIVRVEFYVNGVLQGQDTTAPYSINLSSLAAGTYTLMAKAIDGQNAQTDSLTRTIIVSDTNEAPTVTISAPANGANFPTAPAGFTLAANASAVEVNGWITKVEFYVNGSLVNTDTAGPWSYGVSGIANGSYTLTAKATDQLGAETTSAPVTVTVGPVPTLHFIEVDHLNTPRAIYDANDQLKWRWDQAEPFGVNAPDENPSNLGAFEFPVRFPGQYFDKETNLAYNYFRDYDASTGRYVLSDPIGLRGGINTYSYVGSSPVRYMDPKGLQYRCMWIGRVYVCEWSPPPGGGSGDPEFDKATRNSSGTTTNFTGKGGAGSDGKSDRERCIEICNDRYQKRIEKCVDDYGEGGFGSWQRDLMNSCIAAAKDVLKICLSSCCD